VRPVLYILGDVHLTGEVGAFHAFLDGLARRPPARLVILGDLFEYWLDTAGATSRYRASLHRLRALARGGWRLDLIIGNREMASGRRLAAATGCRIHWPGLTLALGPRRVRVVHGDRLCDDPGYHLLFAFLSGFWFRAWKACHPGAVQDLVARWMRRRSRFSHLRRRRRRTPLGARPEMIDPRRVRAAGRGVDSVVAGHVHQQWRREIAGVELILAGDWSHSNGCWVEGYPDGSLILRRHHFDSRREE